MTVLFGGRFFLRSTVPASPTGRRFRYCSTPGPERSEGPGFSRAGCREESGPSLALRTRRGFFASVSYLRFVFSRPFSSYQVREQVLREARQVQLVAE